MVDPLIVDSSVGMYLTFISLSRFPLYNYFLLTSFSPPEVR